MDDEEGKFLWTRLDSVTGCAGRGPGFFGCFLWVLYCRSMTCLTLSILCDVAEYMTECVLINPALCIRTVSSVFLPLEKPRFASDCFLDGCRLLSFWRPPWIHAAEVLRRLVCWRRACCLYIGGQRSRSLT